MRRPVLCVAVFLSAVATASATAAAAEASPPKPDDFAYGMKFETTGAAAAYVTELPTRVYQSVMRPDLTDIAVFNGRGEVVPHILSRGRTEQVVSVPAVSLPVFPLRGNEEPALEAMRVQIEAGGAKVSVQAPAGTISKTPAEPSAITSYVVDGRTLQGSLAALQFGWPEDAPQFAGRLRIEGGDDLGHWQTLVDAAPIANLRAGDSRLVERRVETRYMRARYWRLSWVGERAPFEITSVVAEPAGNRQDISRSSLSFEGAPVPGTAGAFEFNTGAYFPVDRVNLELPEVNTIVNVELLTRLHSKEPWRPLERAGFYRLRSADTELMNGDVPVGLVGNPYWRVQVDTRGNPLGSGAPKLHIAWMPHKITFLARGPAPFTLAFGNASASAAAGQIPQLPEGASVLHASLGERQPLGGPARLTAPNRPRLEKSTVLWVVLGAAVALLAYMAYRLSRDLKR